MRRTKLCACLSRCSNCKRCGWWSRSISPSIPLSIYLSPCCIPFEEKRQMSICRLTDKHYHSYSHLLLFPYRSLFFSIEQGLRNQTCVRCYSIQQCMFLSSKTLSAISAVSLTSCLVVFLYIEMKKISGYSSFLSTIKMIISLVAVVNNDEDVGE